jgi:hypothetical protein
LRAILDTTHLIFRYAQTWRQGRRFRPPLAESGMNQLVNARMGKRQPMRWSAEGLTCCLQVRCAVLDGGLDELFREW